MSFSDHSKGEVAPVSMFITICVFFKICISIVFRIRFQYTKLYHYSPTDSSNSTSKSQTRGNLKLRNVYDVDFVNNSGFPHNPRLAGNQSSRIDIMVLI